MKMPLSVDHFGYSGFLLALDLLLIPFSRVNLSVLLMGFSACFVCVFQDGGILAGPAEHELHCHQNSEGAATAQSD